MLYFLLNKPAGMVKIGFTTQFNVRRKANEREVGTKLILVGMAKGHRLEEKSLHLRFRSKLANGREWFYADKEILEYLSVYSEQNPPDESEIYPTNGLVQVQIRITPEMRDEIEECRKSFDFTAGLNEMCVKAIREFIDKRKIQVSS